MMLMPFFMPDGAVTYRYFRWSVTKTTASSYLSLTDVRVQAGATDYPTSAMTAANAPNPLVASASSENSASYPAWEAFDRSTAVNADWVVFAPSSGAGVCNEWLKIDLGAGNGITPTSYKLASVKSGAGAREPPVDFTFEGSNDDTNWTLLQTQTGLTTGWTANTLRTFTL